MILVDTNILLDVATFDPVWGRWSAAQLEAAATFAPLAINDIVYAEVSVRFTDIDAVDVFLSTAAVRHLPLPKAALFLAAKAHQAYRRAGGSRTGVLADFFIGAHAVAADAPLLTRDPKPYSRYFPGLRLITPGAAKI